MRQLQDPEFYQELERQIYLELVETIRRELQVKQDKRGFKHQTGPICQRTGHTQGEKVLFIS